MNTSSNTLISKYGDQSRWVNWKLVEIENGKFTKVPYYSKVNKASSTDHKTWTTYEEAASRFDNGSNNFSGVGIMLHDGHLICIDIDHVVENGKIVSQESERILSLLKATDSFTEISQSGTGIHIFIECSGIFKPLANKKAPYEIYADVRFIATTGNSYHKIPKSVRTVSEDDMNTILLTIGYPWGKEKTTTNDVAVVNSESSLTNEEILEIMFRAKNGDTVKKLYEGDTTTYDDDESRADMALLSTLAFYTQKNPAQMEQIWRSSPLGQRKKTQERKDYRDRSIAGAIAICKTVYKPKVKNIKQNVEFLTQVTKTHGEQVIPCKENILIAMRITEGLYGKIRYNEWTEKKEILENGKWRPAVDNDVNIIQSVLANTYSDYALRTASETYVRNAMLQYAMENAIDPAIDYFKSLKWDGVPRLDTWIKNTYNTTTNDKEYQAFGRQWLKALAKRVCVPGCKFDYVLVLEGRQGLRKTTSLRKLMGDWHIEVTTSTNDKDFFMLMRGKAIIEFSEGETQDRSSLKQLKSIITREMDSYRNPYGHETEDRPRRSVFAMSVNGNDYLKDDTGNRRWLPVECGDSINIEWLEKNKDQLFAEAYHFAVTLNENIYEGLESETIRDMQEDRRLQKFEEAKIIDWYLDQTVKQREEGYTLEEIFDMAIAKEGDRITSHQNYLIPPILCNILKMKKVKRVKDGKRRSLYVPTEETYIKYPVTELF